MKTNALIIIWQGRELPDYLVEKISEVLITNGICVPETLAVKYKDSDGVANALMRDAITLSNKTPNQEDEQKLVIEAVKNAMIYISKKFESSLKEKNLTAFAVELSAACISARNTISFNGVNSGVEILNAVEILSTTKAIIPSSLSKKYHFTQNVVDIIKKVYYQTFN